MGRCVIRGVCQKGGSTYRRFKVKGADGRWRDQYVPLPDPSDPRFAVELARVNGTVAPRVAPADGTMAALAVEYRRRMASRALADATRRNQATYVARIETDHGHRRVADLRPRDVYALRNRMADQPGTANNYLAVLRAMMQLACEMGWADHNPVAGVPALALGEHQPWPDDVIAAALGRANPRLRLAIVTALCSGQRVSDIIRMQHNWHDGEMMQFSQQKTGKFVAVPMHPMWLEELARHPRSAVTLLVDRRGKPYAGTDPLQEQLRRLMRQIGHAGFTMHGLRKNACCYLLDLGLSDTQAGAILGMTAEVVRHYGKRANVARIARDAAPTMLGGKIAGLVGK